MALRQKKSLLLAALFCYTLALLVRFHGLNHSAPQADEIHWQARAHQFVLYYRQGQFTHLTDAMTHPGVPPGVLMGVGQVLAEKYNMHRQLVPGQEGHIDRLAASRIANVLFSSLLIPLIFLGGSSFVGRVPAFFAACFLAFDPHHIGLSRQAHIDGALSFFVVCTAFLYLRAVRSNSVRGKIAAGVAWGLSVLCKPTAVGILLAFIPYKLYRNYLLSSENKGERSLISFGDVAAVVVAHAVFAASYTRMWRHNSAYKVRLGVESSVADFLYSAGMMMQPYAIWIAGVSCVLLLYARKRSQFFMLASGAGFLLALIAQIPQVFENIARFWTWVTGLSGETHTAYGMSWAPPEHGYLSLYLAEIPSIILVGFCVGLILMLRSFSKASERQAFLGFCVLAIVCFTAPLSLSSKQTLRYVMPVVPFLYIVSAFGLYRAALFAASWLRVQNARASYRFVPAACALALVLQGCAGLGCFPNYNLFFNALSGGLASAVKDNRGLAISGVNEALHFLHAQEPFASREKVVVEVAGDLQVMKYAYARLFPGEERVRFVGLHGGLYEADYYLEFRQFAPRVHDSQKELLRGESAAFTYRIDGIDLLSAYRVPVPAFEAGEGLHFIAAADAGSRVGALRQQAEVSHANVALGERKITRYRVAKNGEHQRGYLLSGETPRFAAGRYEARFWLRLPDESHVPPTYGPERYALRLDFGRCEQIVHLGDLSATELRPLAVTCDFDKDVVPQLRAYWFGNVPVALAGIELAVWMLKMFRSLFALGVIFLFSFDAYGEPKHHCALYRSKKDEVAVFREPNQTSEIIDTLGLGERVCYIGEVNGFAILDWRKQAKIAGDSFEVKGKEHATGYVRLPDVWEPRDSAHTRPRTPKEAGKRYMEYMRHGGVPENPLEPFGALFGSAAEPECKAGKICKRVKEIQEQEEKEREEGQ